VDGWSREIVVTLPVSNVKRWQSAKVELDTLLSFLSGDYWDFNFYKGEFSYPATPLPNGYADTFKQVNLFSGGLDSLIGAIDFLESNPSEKVLFASHYDSQMGGPLKDQTDLLQMLDTQYPNQFFHIPSLSLTLNNSTVTKEKTFRSRSILFIGIALVAAQAKSIPIIVPENGTVSLNYPLSTSRRSACSTRTTHPTFINKLKALWTKLGINTSITNPYEFHTKGEMVVGCNNQKFLKSVIPISNSCGKRGHRAYWKQNPSASHCGVCMPCVYRQASLLSLKDTTTYGNDLKLLPPFSTQKGQDIGACLEFIKNKVDPNDIKNELIINGLKDLSKISGFVGVVVRTRTELINWIKKTGIKEFKDKAGI
jgi:7-cyano-7-deazaguanine synthase in queuosine biosynthesis